VAFRRRIMLSVDEALRLVLQHAQPLGPEAVELAGIPLGWVLAESVISDIDSPPHDKSVVDGYAVVAAAVSRPGTELSVIEEVTAGCVPSRAIAPGQATRIMTGAPIPSGADAVVMVERTELALAPAETVIIRECPVRPGQNIMRQGTSLRRGETVLAPGKVLRGIECGLLAELGRSQISVVRRPRAAILGTGNELVEHDEIPGPGQIRNSNGLLLLSLAIQAGAHTPDVSSAKDDKEQLREIILRWGLMRDLLIITGGVSAGVLDLVPGVLHELGVEQVFHKVDLKPGKPLWFGIRRHAAGRQTLVFGLPGNPVSSLVCFELFVRPAIQKMCGLPPTGLRRVTAALSMDQQQRGDRPTYWPSAFNEGQVTPLPWKGSGDLRTLTDANCLALFAAGDCLFRRGEEVEVLLLDE